MQEFHGASRREQWDSDNGASQSMVDFIVVCQRIDCPFNR